MKLSAIRQFLNDNKVFFEVIVAALLSFMAIYVSIQANRIAENQTKIMEQENLPQLEIRVTQEYNDQIKLYDNDIWLFYNRGGKLSDFSIEHQSFYKFTYNPDYDTLILPLYSYFNMRGILSGESEGLIYQLDNNHNGVKEVELRDSLANFGYYDINSYVEISYTDIFDQRHNEYFQINPGITRISEKKWNEVNENFMSAKNRFTFSKLNASEITEMIKSNSLNKKLKK